MTQPNLMPELAAVVRDFAAADVVPPAAPRPTPPVVPGPPAPEPWRPVPPSVESLIDRPRPVAGPPYRPPQPPMDAWPEPYVLSPTPPADMTRPGAGMPAAGTPAAPVRSAPAAPPKRQRDGTGRAILLTIFVLVVGGRYVVHHQPAAEAARTRVVRRVQPSSDPGTRRSRRRPPSPDRTGAAGEVAPTAPAPTAPAPTAPAPTTAPPVSDAPLTAARPAPAPTHSADDVQALLDQASDAYGADAPGRAYATATEAAGLLDGLRARSAAPAALAALRARADHLRTLAAQACADHTNPSADVTGCPP